MKVAIFWYGLPYYGARVLGEARKQLSHVQFTIFATSVGVPYENLDLVCGSKINWIDDSKITSWSVIGEPLPEICLLTSWSHPAYMALARDARINNNAIVVSMTDNYFYGSLRQCLGALYFRVYLRGQFHYIWVPGKRSSWFMEFLGMPRSQIRIGLYSADTDLFFPPEVVINRKEIVFVGQFIERKGVQNILKANALNPGGEFRNLVRLIGHGPLKEKLEDSGLICEGFKQAKELGEIYRTASALLLPSLMDHWGVVAHEAALCGCLLLVTKQCGCVDDLVSHRVNGYVMAKSSPSEILLAVKWLTDLAPEEVEIGRRHSLHRASKITPKQWTDNLLSMLPAEQYLSV